MHLLDPAPFGRILPAMVTPMKSDGAVDYDAAQTIARQLVADGADGIVVNGTTGESPTTHMDEKVELVRAVKDVVDVPVISGAGSNDTAHTVRMVEQTQEAGADAVLVVCPYYSRPSQQGIFYHYRAVNESADKPIIVYDVPGRTGVRISLDTYCHISELDHVCAVKDATGDIAGAVRKRLETGLTWYSGDDALFLPFLSIGAVRLRPRRCAPRAGARQPHRPRDRRDERHRLPGRDGQGRAQRARSARMHRDASAECGPERRADRRGQGRAQGVRAAVTPNGRACPRPH